MSHDPYLPPGASEREIAIRRRVRRQAGFYRHLAIYVAVNLGLWTVNLVQLAMAGRAPELRHLWAVWPSLGWGVGVLVHGLSALPLPGLPTAQWEERKVRELMSRDGR